MLRWFNKFITRLLLRNISYAEEHVAAIQELSESHHLVFVLPFASLLIHAALRRAIKERGLPPETPIFYLSTPKTLLTARKRAKYDLLGLIETEQSKATKPVMIVPHTLILGRRRARADRSAMDLVFGTRDSPGFLRLLLSLILNKRSAHWQIGEGTTLEEAKAKQNLIFVLRRQFRRLEGTHIGPKAKSYDRIRRETLRDAGLRQYLESTSASTGVPMADLIKKSQRYFKEIAAHFDGEVVRLLRLLLHFTFHRLYDGIFWNSSEIAQLRKASLKGPLILLPTHKSHMDYLVLSYLLYEEGLMPPHIAAGANLSFFPLGAIFRRGGAYFIRRQFKGDPLYAKMVRAYLNRLLKEGFTQEFFIEGGRTRTGKTLAPKLGLLSIYVDCLCTQPMQDAVFVPISISYERIVESQSYDEEQAGKAKTKESAKGLITSSQVLLKRFGRVFVSFDKPIVFSELMAAKRFDPSTASEEEKRRFIRGLAHQVVAGMNDSVTVTPASLIAMVILSSKTRAMRVDRFLAQTLNVLGMLQASYPEVKLSESLANYSEASLESALSLLAQDGQIVKRESKNLSYILAPAKKARSLNFYKNTIIHFFVSDALIACAYLAESQRHQSTNVTLAALKSRTLILSQIFKFEFSFAPLMTFDEIFAKRLEFLIKRDVFLVSDDHIQAAATTQAKDDVEFLARILHPFLETYFVAFDAAGSDISKIMKQLDDALVSGLITRPEAVNKQSCEAALQFIRSLPKPNDLPVMLRAITDVLDAME